MNSSLLVVIGIVGLVGCGVVRAFPYIKGLVPLRPVGGGTHDVVDAYSVIHRALLDAGENEQATHLRTKVLPAAIQVKEPGE